MNLVIDTDYGKQFEPVINKQALGDEINYTAEKEIGWCQHCHRPSEFFPGTRNEAGKNKPVYECKRCHKHTEIVLSLDEIKRYEQLSAMEQDGWTAAACSW